MANSIAGVIIATQLPATFQASSYQLPAVSTCKLPAPLGSGQDAPVANSVFGWKGLAHPSAKFEVGGSGAEHSPERTGQMCPIRKAGDVGRLGRGRSIHQLTRASLNAEPQKIAPERNTNRFREDVHETRWRKTRYRGQGLQREIFSPPKSLPDVFEHAIDCRVNLHGAAPV